MSEKFTVGLIQNCATPDTGANVAETVEMTRAAAAEGAELVITPEYFTGLDTDGATIVAPAFPEEGHPALPAFTALARELGIVIQLGSLAIARGDGKNFNRGYLIGRSGKIEARYDKICLFDVDLAGGESYRESNTIAGGAEAVLAETPWGPLGMTICYDLRFPQIYRSLAQAGARYLTVPAAFTKTTGEAHWHILNRARAIENSAYVFAPCQCGTHAGGAKSFGHSLVVAPWGEVLADGGEAPGVVTAEIDPAEVEKARGMIPAWGQKPSFELGRPNRIQLAGE
ncbi:MAG: carbon-nitrogen hydrolase family protein [Rhodovibrionaceae bacterium]